MHLVDTSARTTRSNKLEPIRDDSEAQNQYFQDAYIPGSHMTAEEQLVVFTHHTHTKPGENGIFGVAIFKLLKFQMK